MDDRSDPSCAGSKNSLTKDLCSHGYANHRHVQAESAYSGSHHHTAYPEQHNSVASTQTTQTSYPDASTSYNSQPTGYEQQETQQYDTVPRPDPLNNPTTTRVLYDPALERAITYGYNPHAPFTYHPVPESSSSSHGTSRRTTEINLQRHVRQTPSLSNLVAWKQESPHDEPWNAIEKVGNPSEYDPFNTKL